MRRQTAAIAASPALPLRQPTPAVACLRHKDNKGIGVRVVGKSKNARASSPSTLFDRNG